MRTFKVEGFIDVRIPVEIVVEAEDEEEARHQAEEEFHLRGENVRENFENEDVLDSGVETVEEMRED